MFNFENALPLTPFVERFGYVLAVSFDGAGEVRSALTEREHIYYDAVNGEYVRESR